MENNVRSKFNFKFSNLLDMSKGRICVGNYMDIISMVLGYIDVNFQKFLAVKVLSIRCRVWKLFLHVRLISIYNAKKIKNI